jgi:hypothetical protein
MGAMFLRAHERRKDDQEHTYWSLVETVRTADGPRQRTLCYLGELNSSAQARWLKTVEVFNEQGESQQLKLFPSDVEPPANDPNVARVILNKVRLERTRQFGACWLGLQLWKQLGLDHFFAPRVDGDRAEVPWSQIAAVLAINRLCAPGSELKIEEHRPSVEERAVHSAVVSSTRAARESPRAGGISRLCHVGHTQAPAQALAIGTVSRQGSCVTCHLAQREIVLPTTDGREIRLRRITEPTSDQKQLLQLLRLPRPDPLRFAPKCSADSATA